MLCSRILVVFLFSNSFLLAQTGWQDTVQRINQVFERYKPEQPGAQVAISRHGQIIFSKAWGMAELEHTVPLTTQSILDVASVTKQFVAASILHLVQEGKLSLDTEIHTFFPQLPSYGVPVRIRHLLQQTSGIRDWENIVDMAGWPSSSRTYNHSYALHVISRQQQLNHPPGEEHSYSNSNYILLTLLIEKVSGMSLNDYTKKIIFEPAGMMYTSWRTNYRKVVPRKATAYVKSQGVYYENMPISNAASILSTAEDLLRWNHFYLSGKFGQPSLLNQQLEAAVFPNGMTNTYRSGLVADTLYGYSRISHSGATAGYRSNLEYFPALGLSIAFLSNTSEFDFDKTSAEDELRKIFLSPTERTSLPTEQYDSVPAGAAATGWYRHLKSNAGMKLLVKQGKLFSSFRNSALLKNKDGSTIYLADREAVFSGKLLTLINSQGEKDIYEFMKDTASFHELPDYTGTFYSPEAEATWTLTIKDGQLNVLQRPGRELNLQPTYRDGFDSGAGTLLFRRDKKGKISGFSLSTWRARGVFFEKTK